MAIGSKDLWVIETSEKIVIKPLSGESARDTHCRLGVGCRALLSGQNGCMASGSWLGWHMSYTQLPLAVHDRRAANAEPISPLTSIFLHDPTSPHDTASPKHD